MKDVKEKISMADVVQEKNSQKRDEKYNKYVKNVTPKHSWLLNLCKAYLIGGIFCVVGQGLIEIFKTNGADKELAGLLCTISLVLISVLMTGFGLYSKLAKFGGAGTVVPITGFANSVAAPAIEFQKEGQVFGIGCKIFTIAGPVILYGIFSSWVFGLIYYILTQTNLIK